MNVDVDFVSVMVHLGLDIRKNYGNYKCPFCFKKSFTVYHERPHEMGHCHNQSCKWSGDAIKLYSEHRNISYNEAKKELGVAVQNKFIQLREQTYEDAKSEFAKDLEFLAWVRIYEGFYPEHKRFKRKIFEDKTDLNKSTLSKIINGQLGNPLTWRKVLAVLRSDLEKPIDKLKKDIALGPKYFENLLDNEERGYDIKKYRIKKMRRPRSKK